MRAADATSPLLQDPVSWRFDFDLFFLFEIDIDAVSVRPPPGMFLQEVRPGTALVGVGCNRGAPHNLGRLPAFHEITWCVGLQPDLSRPMPVPQFAVLTGAIASDCPAFLDYAAERDKMVVAATSGLRVAIDHDAQAVSVEDDAGPIFSMGNTLSGPLDYRPRSQWIQLGSRIGAGWAQAARWSGHVYEHQRGHRAGTFHDHPFFDGIDVSGMGDRCYMQMMARPGAPIEVVFHEPMPSRGRR